jgi:hypothetical protein
MTEEQREVRRKKRVIEYAEKIGLARMLDEASDLPCSKTVWTWMAAMPEFSQKVASAKEHQLDRMQDLGVQLIDSVDIGAVNAPVALARAKASAEADRFAIRCSGRGRVASPRCAESVVRLRVIENRRPGAN